jgi:hypothetical protein
MLRAKSIARNMRVFFFWLAPMLKLSIPYHSQWNNDRDWDTGPWNECSFTCMAMMGRAIGAVGNGDGQFEDQVERSFERRGYKRGLPEHMSRWMSDTWRLLGYRFWATRQGTAAMIRKALAAGYPVICHTDLTASGHVVIIVGDDPGAYGGEGAWIVHDPWGEWFPGGYNVDASGAFVRYSYALMDLVAGPDGNWWLHWPEKITG